MEQRFQRRKREMLAQCKVAPQIFDGMIKRLHTFSEEYVSHLCRKEQRDHAELYLGGLMSDLERKNIESIAYRSGEDRHGLQRFMGSATWDHKPMINTLVGEVAEAIGDPMGVIVFDPSGFKKQGKDSVGVSRQWLGRLGKVDNGQVGIYMGYASGKEHVLLDTRLYLSKKWAKDKKRRKKCGIPKEVCHQTRHELALEMLDTHGPRLPHRWITGDDEMGHVTWFRRALRDRGEQYLLAVPFNTTIRDLEGKKPPQTHSGAGAQPKRKFENVRHWAYALPEEDWAEITIRSGDKGPLKLKMVKRRVATKIQKWRVSKEEELLVVTRRQEEDGTWKHDYFLSNAPSETSLEELGRAIKAEHRIEDSLKRAKSEAGLADYEVRSWRGWYRHQALSLIATWFLIQESLRGRKWTPAMTVPQVREGLATIFRNAQAGGGTGQIRQERMRKLQRNELARFYHWKKHNLLAPLRSLL